MQDRHGKGLQISTRLENALTEGTGALDHLPIVRLVLNSNPTSIQAHPLRKKLQARVNMVELIPPHQGHFPIQVPSPQENWVSVKNWRNKQA